MHQGSTDDQADTASRLPPAPAPDPPSDLLSITTSIGKANAQRLARRPAAFSENEPVYRRVTYASCVLHGLLCRSSISYSIRVVLSIRDDRHHQHRRRQSNRTHRRLGLLPRPSPTTSHGRGLPPPLPPPPRDVHLPLIQGRASFLEGSRMESHDYHGRICPGYPDSNELHHTACALRRSSSDSGPTGTDRPTL